MVPALTGCGSLSHDGEQALKPKLWSRPRSCISDPRNVPLGASPSHQSQSLSIPFSVDPEDFSSWALRVGLLGNNSFSYFFHLGHLVQTQPGGIHTAHSKKKGPRGGEETIVDHKSRRGDPKVVISRTGMLIYPNF